MKNLMEELLETYYKGFAKKQGWETVISDDFKFVGGDMTEKDAIVGKRAYIDIIKRFSQLFDNMRLKKLIIDGNQACVIEDYDTYFQTERLSMATLRRYGKQRTTN
ncbi:MAG TPA: hypothetical protein VF540_13225 [Segetibacter sp.]